MNSTQLVPIGQRPPPAELAGILAADTPAGVIERAVEVAKPLAKLVDDQRLSITIRGRKHVRIEAWATCGAMLGLTTREVSVVESDGNFVATYEVVRVADDRIVGRASGSCGKDESTWKSRPAFARRGMACTRAQSRAFRSVLSWIVALAGYDPTPSEEIDEPGDPPAVTTRQGGDSRPAVVIDMRYSQSEDDPATDDQQQHIRKLVKSLGLSRDAATAHLVEHGANRLAELPVGTAADIIRKLEFKQTESETPF